MVICGVGFCSLCYNGCYLATDLKSTLLNDCEIEATRCEPKYTFFIRNVTILGVCFTVE